MIQGHFGKLHQLIIKAGINNVSQYIVFGNLCQMYDISLCYIINIIYCQILQPKGAEST